jgi:CelD/BcsL family acetyltransferase involved in cellulose biosynthesis
LLTAQRFSRPSPNRARRSRASSWLLGRSVAGDALSPQDFAGICRKLGARYALDLILFRKVRADSGLAGALAAHGLAQNAADTAPYIDLAAFGSFAAYEASFSSPTRRNRRQRLERLEEACGTASFSVVTAGEGLAFLDQAIAWKEGWLADQGLKSAVLDGGPWQQALRASARMENAVTSVLFAGGRPAAVELGYHARGVYTSYLGAFDPELSRFSVGQEQMLRTIAWAYEVGVSRYDLMAPGDAYKRLWTRTANTAVGVEDYAVALSTLGRGMAEVRRRARPAARSLVLNMRPGVRVAGARLAKPAAIAAVALGVAALAVD